jgi:hypothetical protein
MQFLKSVIGTLERNQSRHTLLGLLDGRRSLGSRRLENGGFGVSSLWFRYASARGLPQNCSSPLGHQFGQFFDTLLCKGRANERRNRLEFSYD